MLTIDQIKAIAIPVLKKHKVKKAGLFGSVANQKANEGSDVDILVELTYPASLLDFVGIKLDLEDALHKKVDLVEYQAIKSILKDSILKSEVRMYG
jgi:uncharacterized protein